MTLNYAQNPQARASRKYHLTHREKHCQQMRDYYRKNRDQIRAQKKAAYHSDPEYTEYRREYMRLAYRVRTAKTPEALEQARINLKLHTMTLPNRHQPIAA